MSGTIVLKIPYESTSFQAARAALQEPLPVETYAVWQEILSRIQEWTGITVALEDAAYIPLRTDWIPPRDRRTADGVEILLGARWPDDVQLMIDARRTAVISGPLMGRFWEMICDCQEVSEVSDVSSAPATVLSNIPAADGVPQAAAAVATPEEVAEGAAIVPEERPDAAAAESKASETREIEFRAYLAESLEVAMTEEIPEDWIQRISNYPQPHEPGPWETPQGYRMLWDAAAQRIVFEHRYIYEKYHGAIPSGYVIHHINGIKNDNRIENLQMMTPSEHTRLHAALRRSMREQNEVSQISPISTGADNSAEAVSSALSVGRDPYRVAGVYLNGKQSEAPEVAPERVEAMVSAVDDNSAEGSAGGVQNANAAPPVDAASRCSDTSARREEAGTRAPDVDMAVVERAPVIPDTEPVESAIPLHLIDGWPWSHIVAEIRTRAAIYPEAIPDPNEITEAEARALLKTMLRHPAVVAEAERQGAVAEARRAEYRDARTIQYAIGVGVELPDPTPPPVAQEFSCTDDGNGDRLVAQYRDSIRFCKTFDAWFLWDGSRWERDETCRMLALAKRVARTIHIEASATTDDRREKVGKWALSSGMLSRLKAMITCACPAVAVTPDEFDAHPTLLNCRNGTLELDALTFREAHREDLLTKQAGVAYDPTATCSTWLWHLQTIFAGDAEIIEGFQQMCGYSLLGSNPEEVMFILWGRGKNGKSVTVKALAHVLGDYAVSLGAESLMVQRGAGARPDLAKLKGVRMAAASEVDEGAKLAENIVKQYTSSNDTVAVRRLYENEFEFTPTAKIWLATNHEPQIRGTDDGIWRRIWMLPFTVQIAEEQRDPNMIDKLTAEAAGILNWMIEGLRKYHANGSRLTPPARVITATRRYRMESDSLGRAIDEELVCGDAARGRIIARKELTNSLRQWFAEQDEKMPGPRMVAKALRERGVADGPVQGGVRYWVHLRWKTDEEQEDDGIGR